MMWLDQERFDTSKETLCTSLRWKQQFISSEHDPTVPPSNDGLFWCMHTQTCIGPTASWPNPATARRRTGSATERGSAGSYLAADFRG